MFVGRCGRAWDSVTGAHHGGEHGGRLLTLDGQHVGGVAAFAGVEHVEGALVALGEYGEFDRLVGFDDSPRVTPMPVVTRSPPTSPK
jgi:hypothetical protein